MPFKVQEWKNHIKSSAHFAHYLAQSKGVLFKGNLFRFKFGYLECKTDFGGDLSDLEAVCILQVLSELHVLHLPRTKRMYMIDKDSNEGYHHRQHTWNANIQPCTTKNECNLCFFLAQQQRMHVS